MVMKNIMRKTRGIMILVLVFVQIACIMTFMPTPVKAAVDTSIVPSNFFKTWNPGIPYGVPNVTIVYTTIDASTYGNGTTDATSAINNAIQAAGAVATSSNRQVVYLPAGTYKISGTLLMNKSNVVLRGAGIRQTYIRGSSNHRGIAMGENWPTYQYTPAINVTGSISRGATSITVADASSIQAGDILRLDQLEDGDPLGTYGWVWRIPAPRSTTLDLFIISVPFILYVPAGR
jgi:hypothetical protein